MNKTFKKLIALITIICVLCISSVMMVSATDNATSNNDTTTSENAGSNESADGESAGSDNTGSENADGEGDKSDDSKADEKKEENKSGEQQKQSGSIWPLLIFYVAIFGIFGYFMIYRPNKKRKKEEEKLRASIMLGAQVVSIGGICGTIVNIKDDVITIESSIDRTLIEFKNWAIREIKNPISDDDSTKEIESK